MAATIAQQLGHRDGVHPLQALDAGDVAALDDAVDQQVGLVVAQRLAQHGLDVLVGVGHQRAHFRGLGREPIQHAVDAIAADGLELGDGFAEVLDLLGLEVLEDLGGLLFTQ
jgi:hypothetical protein